MDKIVKVGYTERTAKNGCDLKEGLDGMERAAVVMKFGGAAVSSPECFSEIARLIAARREKNQPIVVVVSAMRGQTDRLIELAKKVNPSPPRREMDMLISVGERISISLLAMALHRHAIEAISFTGSQSGIITTDEHTDAKILDVRPRRILAGLEGGRVVIVAGFQGVSTAGEITTLGRGGSDTSAVALAAALGADCVEFFKDVDGIYESDPKLDETAAKFDEMTYDRLLELKTSALSLASVWIAKRNGVPLFVRSFHDKTCGTWIRDPLFIKPPKPLFDREGSGPIAILS